MSSIRVISASEIAKVNPNYNQDYPDIDPVNFKKMLWDLGIDIYKPFEIQTNLWHRNAFNEVVYCDRYVGAERLDREYINSGYATREAKQLASGNRMLLDLNPSLREWI